MQTQTTSLLFGLLALGALANPASADYQLNGRIVRVPYLYLQSVHPAVQVS